MIDGFSPDHPAWLVLREEIGSRIEKGRTALETSGLSIADTENIRGQIAGLRMLVRDIEELPVEPISAPSYEA